MQVFAPQCPGHGHCLAGKSGSVENLHSSGVEGDSLDEMS